MVEFSKILDSSIGRIIIGILWGFGLSAIFFNTCNNQTCEVPVYQGPNPNIIKKSVYQNQDLCYRFSPYIVKCPNRIF